MPQGCAVAVGAIGEVPASAFADEDALVEAAAPKRRREFRAGRSLARRALAKIGAPPGPLMARAEGDPIWPRGFVGSISHAGDLVAAIAAPSRLLAGVGLDIEPDRRLEAELKAFVCRPDEADDETSLAGRALDAAMLRFVAKEASFKATFPLTRESFDFLDVRVVFETDADAFRIEAPRHRSPWPFAREMVGRFSHADGFLTAVAYFPA